MEKRIKIAIAVIIAIMLFILGGVLYIVLSGTIYGDPISIDIEFYEDATNRTLTIMNITPADLSMNWDTVLLISGNATLPTGDISIGDIITNCSDSGELGYTFRQSYNFFTGWKTITLPLESWDYT